MRGARAQSCRYWLVHDKMHSRRNPALKIDLFFGVIHTQFFFACLGFGTNGLSFVVSKAHFHIGLSLSTGVINSFRNMLCTGKNIIYLTPSILTPKTFFTRPETSRIQGRQASERGKPNFVKLLETTIRITDANNKKQGIILCL